MFTLPDLPYDYSALEPFIDSETMHLHHDKHHAAYVKNLNDALAGQPDWLNKDVEDVIKNLSSVPEDIRTKVRNNAGGHANHAMYWQTMQANPNSEKRLPSGILLRQIQKDFGDFEAFKKKFTETALGHFGSGWAWLVWKDLKLVVTDTSNQDSPLSDGAKPILLIDVWEHAYYLKYKNMRADYINAWWNIVNWEKVTQLFVEGTLAKNGGEMK